MDDWSFSAVRSYIQTAKSANATLEGVLFMGNIKMPSYYKPRNDILNTRIWPHYYEDLDGIYQKLYADGAVDPDCNAVPAGSTQCAVGGPYIVPRHDFDYQAKGPNPGPELWASYMPVGVDGSANDYTVFANQLTPYLQKVTSFYNGQITNNGRLYFVSNDIGQRFDEDWDAFGPALIDFYGMPGPNGETGDACLVNGQNLCYKRWPTETYPNAQAFISYYQSQPWVGENWQQDTIFISDMDAATYDAVEVNVHSFEMWSLVSNTQASAITRAGLFVTLDGCSVGGFAQPNSPSNVDDSTIFVSDNVMLAYLYGSPKALAAAGDPNNRGHYAHFPYMYKSMKVGGAYLGKAHLLRMQRQYDLAGTDWTALRENTAEILVGDPFMRI